MIGQDSNVYPEGEVPDLGSIRVIRNEGGIREYALLSADFSKLPTYANTGSTAICVDTNEAYMLHDSTWYQL